MAGSGFAFGTSRFNQSKVKGAGREVAIGQLRHRVVLCTSDDVIISGSTIAIARREAARVYASIETKRGQQWTRDGLPAKDGREQSSHSITIRHRRGVKISAFAWVYHERKDEPPRWYKVIDRKETDPGGQYDWFVTLSCRLVEEADDLVTPAPAGTDQSVASIVSGLPEGVTL